MPTKSGRPSLEEDEAERVRDALRRALALPRFDGNKTKLGEVLDMSQSAIGQILSGKNAPSLQTARAVAKVIGEDVWALLGDRPAPVVRQVEVREDRYPTRAFVLAGAEATMEHGGWLMEDIERVRSMALEYPGDPGADFWMRQLYGARDDRRAHERDPGHAKSLAEQNDAIANDVASATAPKLPKRKA